MAENKGNQNIEYYCAHLLLPQIEILRNTADKASHRKNIEDIHDLRVSSRRIREYLNVFGFSLPKKKYKNWQKEIRSITKSFGIIRDLDVQYDLIQKIYRLTEDKKIRSGLRRLRLRLKQKREKNQGKTQSITSTILENQTLAEMRSWCEDALNYPNNEIQKTKSLYELGYKHVQDCLDKVLFYEIFIFDPNRVEELHKMRIAAKHLRYSLEIFSDLYEGKTDFALAIAREIQQYLGEIHDADVWVEYLPQFMDTEYKQIKNFYGYTSPFSRIKPGIEYLLENRKTERENLYRKFIDSWKKWKMQETWLDLRKIIFLSEPPTAEPVSEPTPPTDSGNKNPERT